MMETYPAHGGSFFQTGEYHLEKNHINDSSGDATIPLLEGKIIDFQAVMNESLDMTEHEKEECYGKLAELHEKLAELYEKIAQDEVDKPEGMLVTQEECHKKAAEYYEKSADRYKISDGTIASKLYMKAAYSLNHFAESCEKNLAHKEAAESYAKIAALYKKIIHTIKDNREQHKKMYDMNSNENEVSIAIKSYIENMIKPYINIVEFYIKAAENNVAAGDLFKAKLNYAEAALIAGVKEIQEEYSNAMDELYLGEAKKIKQLYQSCKQEIYASMAANLYEKCGKYEKSGDMYVQINQFDKASRAYHYALDSIDDPNHDGISRLETKLNTLEQAEKEFLTLEHDIATHHMRSRKEKIAAQQTGVYKELQLESKLAKTSIDKIQQLLVKVKGDPKFHLNEQSGYDQLTSFVHHVAGKAVRQELIKMIAQSSPSGKPPTTLSDFSPPTGVSREKEALKELAKRTIHAYEVADNLSTLKEVGEMAIHHGELTLHPIALLASSALSGVELLGKLNCLDELRKMADKQNTGMYQCTCMGCKNNLENLIQEIETQKKIAISGTVSAGLLSTAAKLKRHIAQTLELSMDKPKEIAQSLWNAAQTETSTILVNNVSGIVGLSKLDTTLKQRGCPMATLIIASLFDELGPNSDFSQTIAAILSDEGVDKIRDKIRHA